MKIEVQIILDPFQEHHVLEERNKDVNEVWVFKPSGMKRAVNFSRIGTTCDILSDAVLLKVS